MTIKTPLVSGKFQNPDVTAKGEKRASVELLRLETLWLNTGTLCNLECANCYIESSPTNDRLAYLARDEAQFYLSETRRLNLNTREIGITGGEPFMNPDIINIMSDALEQDFDVLVLTNAMKPLTHHQGSLLALKETHGDRLSLRVSVDHYKQAVHEQERGTGSWAPMLAGLNWLSQNRFSISVAGRRFTDEPEDQLRQGYKILFADENIDVDAMCSESLILFPEMDATADIAEITVDCWKTLDVLESDQMCATSRMVVKRKGAAGPTVVSCTLLPDDPAFEYGPLLADALHPVKLNHPHCARFCVMGGGSCSV